MCSASQHTALVHAVQPNIILPYPSNQGNWVPHSFKSEVLPAFAPTFQLALIETMQPFLISVDDPQLLKADVYVMNFKTQLLLRIHAPR